MDLAFIALLPFIQLGFSYWLSFSTLAAIMVVLRLREQLAAGLKHHPWILTIPLFMIWPLFTEPSLDSAQDLLKTARQALFAGLMIAIINGCAIVRPRINIRLLQLALSALLPLLLGLVLVQFVLLRGGVYLGFPEEAYSNELGTIPGAMDLRYSALRPAGPFSEPSYLSFIMLSATLFLLAVYQNTRSAKMPIIGAIAIGLLSQAASFVVFQFALVGAYVERMVRGPMRVLVLPVLVVALLFAIGLLILTLGSDVEILSRLRGGASATGDVSIFVRIFGPLQAIPGYLSRFPLGLPDSVIQQTIAPYALSFGVEPADYLMNGMFNLIFSFGILGLVIVAFFLVRRNLILIIYLVSCMMFNGSFLSHDKLAVIGFFVAAYYAARASGVVASADKIALRGEVTRI